MYLLETKCTLVAGAASQEDGGNRKFKHANISNNFSMKSFTKSRHHHRVYKNKIVYKASKEDHKTNNED